jgi:hypothetical protein
MELKTPITVSLMHVNMRTETHGDESVDAYDLDFVLEGANADVLGLLDPELCGAFYFRAKKTEDEPDLPGVAQILPNLRFPKLGKVPWVDKLEGADLFIEYGTGRATSNISLPGGKSQTKTLENKEGGTALLAFQFSTSNMPDSVLDKLRKKLKQELTITLVQSETARQEAKAKQADLDIGGEVSGEPAALPAAPAPQRKPGAAERAAVDKVKGVDASSKPPHKEAKPKKTEPTVDKAKQPPKSTPAPAPVRTARGAAKTKRELAAGLRAAAATDAFAKAHGKGKKS